MLLYIIVNICILGIFIYVANNLLTPRFTKSHKALSITATLICTAITIAFDYFTQEHSLTFATTINVLFFIVFYISVIAILYKDRLCRIAAFSTLSLSLNVFSNGVLFYCTTHKYQCQKEMPFVEYVAVQAKHGIIPYTIFFATMLILATMLIRFLKKIPPEIPSRYWYLLTLIEFLNILLLGILWDMQIMISPGQFFNIYANILFAGLIAASILSITLFSGITEFYTRKQQFILLSAQNEALAHKLQVEYNTNENLRRLKHEMNSLLTTVYTLLEEKKYPEIKTIVTGKIDVLTRIEYEKYTDNYIIDALLNYKIAEIKKQNIPLETQLAHLDIELPFEPLDICSILFNLIDNAIEANMLINENIENRFIYIKICTYKQYVTITVKNAYNGKINVQNEQIKTTKPDSELHGYGIKNITHCVNKYKGIFQYSYTNNEFIAKVFLPLQ